MYKFRGRRWVLLGPLDDDSLLCVDFVFVLVCCGNWGLRIRDWTPLSVFLDSRAQPRVIVRGWAWKSRKTQKGFHPNMMKILNFTKWKVLKTRYLPFCKIIALGRAQKSRKTHKGLLSPRWWTFLISGILWNGRYLKTGTFHFGRFLKWSSSHSVLGGALNYTAEV